MKTHAQKYFLKLARQLLEGGGSQGPSDVVADGQGDKKAEGEVEGEGDEKEDGSISRDDLNHCDGYPRDQIRS